jgi:hypothetical protein
MAAVTRNADENRKYARVLPTVYFNEGISTITMVNKRVYIVPIQIPYMVIIDRLAYTLDTVSAGNVRMGLYRDNGDTPVGGALVVESGSVAKAGTGRKQEVTIPNTQLTPGLYWLAVLSDESTTIIYRCDGAYGTGGTLLACYYDIGAYGALTNPCPAITLSNVADFSGYVRVLMVP